MKKILSLTLAACAAASTTFLLSSCEEHEHVFQATWEINETHHWHACETELCDEQADKAEHDYVETADAEGNYVKVCQTCEYAVILVPNHEHVYKTEWANNEDCHWKACETDGCTEKSEQTDHNFMQETTHGADYIETVYTCDVCQYTYTDRMTIETVVPDEKTWIDAFNDLTYTNYTANVYFGEGEYAINNKVSINETSGYFLMDYSMVYGLYVEYYTQLQPDGSYVTYGRTSKDGNYMLLNDKTNYYYLEIISQSLMILKYDEHYDAFTYNEEKGTYFCEEIIESIYNPDQESEEYSSTLYCKNTEIKVADGKILSIQADYVVWYPDWEEKEYPTEEDFQSIIIYDQIGMTIVTIPTAVKENALADDGWFDEYFKKDSLPEEDETSNETSNESSNEFESKENTDN